MAPLSTATAAGPTPGSSPPPAKGRTPTPLPLAKLVVIGVINLMNTASYLMTFPFVPWMILSFFPPPAEGSAREGSAPTGAAGGATLDKEEIGFYSGLLEGTFHVGAFIGAIFWGWFSDKYGRRPALLLGLLGTMGASVFFGLSSRFWMAVCARFLWGLLNGNVGVAKTALSELCDDTNSARAFSFIGLNTGFGRVIGPLLGGMLSEPATRYPSLFGGSPLLVAYPFLLPCLVAAAMTGACLVMAYFVLEETQHLSLAEAKSYREIDAAAAARRSQQMEAAGANAGKRSTKVEEAVAGKGRARKAAGGDVRVSVQEPRSAVAVAVAISAAAQAVAAKAGAAAGSSSRGATGGGGTSGGAYSRVGAAGGNADEDSEDEDVDVDDVVVGGGGGGGVQIQQAGTTKGKDDKEADGSGGAPHKPDPKAGSATPAAAPFDDPRDEGTWAGLLRLSRDPPVAIACAVYSALGLVGLVSNELFPLYVLNDAAHGGFGWTSEKVGLSGFAAGPFLILFQAFGYDWVVRRFGLLTVLRFSLAAFAVLLAATPLQSAALALPTTAMQDVVLFTHAILTNLARVTAFICVFVIVANSAMPEDRGRVNGLGQATVSVVRALGPPLGTSAFAASVGPWATAAGWPFNFHFVWYVMSLLALGTLALTYELPSWIEGKRGPASGR